MAKLGLEIIPAILAKTKEELLDKIAKVRPYATSVQIDVMDGKFVNNKTIGLAEIKTLPSGVNYEFHWMVNDPDVWISSVPGNHLHIVHIEAVKTWNWIERALKKSGGRIGIAINPDTDIDKLFRYLVNVERVLVMTVRPGFSAQSYVPEAEAKIKILREKLPQMDIEVDGGINKATIVRARRAGANKFAIASAIFSYDSVGEAIRELKQTLEEDSYG